MGLLIFSAVAAGGAFVLFGMATGVHRERKRVRRADHETRWYVDRACKGEQCTVFVTRSRGSCMCGGSERAEIGAVVVGAENFDVALAQLEGVALDRALTLNAYEREIPYRFTGDYGDYP
jgi:hypothetical protein